MRTFPEFDYADRRMRVVLRSVRSSAYPFETVGSRQQLPRRLNCTQLARSGSSVASLHVFSRVVADASQNRAHRRKARRDPLRRRGGSPRHPAVGDAPRTDPGTPGGARPRDRSDTAKLTILRDLIRGRSGCGFSRRTVAASSCIEVNRSRLCVEPPGVVLRSVVFEHRPLPDETLHRSQSHPARTQPRCLERLLRGVVNDGRQGCIPDADRTGL